MFKIVYHPNFSHPLPEGHRFPMIKYELIPQQLIHHGIITAENIHQPNEAAVDSILLTHDLAYWKKLQQLGLSKQEERRTGFPLSKELVEREITIAQGSIDAALFALEYGVSLNVAGGTHHSFKDFGEGFCLLNDFAISANYLLHHNKIKKALICDLDVHQGNGTAKIFEDNSSVFTFSMHGKDNFPHRKEKSDLDIELHKNMDDAEYLDILKRTLPSIIEKEKPDILYYLSGVDVLKTDKLGKLGLSNEGCAFRDEFVFETAVNYGLPCTVAMGGGYSERIKDIVNAHCKTFELAKKLYSL
jgi:acetoin utilization deacetylase AcuC-like enzyme